MTSNKGKKRESLLRYNLGWHFFAESGRGKKNKIIEAESSILGLEGTLKIIQFQPQKNR